MILTNCAACAAPLAHTAPRCVRCQTRYCNKTYSEALYLDPDATLSELREAVATLEEMERAARRVFGGAHPSTSSIERSLQNSRDKLAARETPPPRGA